MAAWSNALRVEFVSSVALVELVLESLDVELAVAVVEDQELELS